MIGEFVNLILSCLDWYLLNVYTAVLMVRNGIRIRTRIAIKFMLQCNVFSNILGKVIIYLGIPSSRYHICYHWSNDRCRLCCLFLPQWGKHVQNVSNIPSSTLLQKSRFLYSVKNKRIFYLNVKTKLILHIATFWH